MVMVEPESLSSSFNASYAYSNIIGVDETVIDKQNVVEKVKSLSTKSSILVNMKHITEHMIPFYGKVVFASNKEDDFMRIDDEEIRYWIRKIPGIKESNHMIEQDLLKEIPAFMYTLLHKIEPIDYNNLKSRQVFKSSEIENEELSKVKKESMSGLYKDMVIEIEDLFNSRPTCDEFKLTLSQIKSRWFASDNKVTKSWISKCLKREFKLEPRLEKYDDPDNPIAEKKVGRVYTFTRTTFLTGLTEQPPPTDDNDELIDVPF